VSRRRSSIWLFAYPPAWRARYGQELEDLLAQSRPEGAALWQVRLDLLRAGAAERLRSWGLSRGTSAMVRAKTGVLVVFCGWAVFVPAGLALQKSSEHWQSFTPTGGRPLASIAFQVLLVTAVVAGGLVLAGGGCALPALRELLRGGGWSEIRGRVFRAVGVSALAILATAGLVFWARRLGVPQRNGHDAIYGLGFIGCGLLVTASIGTWTAAAVATFRRLEMPPRLLKLEISLAAALGGAMVVMTAAAATWWVSLAVRAPWALHERLGGPHSAAVTPQVLAAVLLMAGATALAGLGTLWALGALRQLPGGRAPG
jgi:hypothetical protein